MTHSSDQDEFFNHTQTTTPIRALILTKITKNIQTIVLNALNIKLLNKISWAAWKVGDLLYFQLSFC